MIYWAMYCMLDGINDGFFYYYKNPNIKGRINEHTIKLLTRLTVFLMVWDNNYWNLLIFALMQPFLHNNFYYNTRHYLNDQVYNYGIRSQSRNSTALSTKFLTPVVRVVMFIIGITLYFVL